jgi:acyl-CoA thioesterase FadM
VTTRCTKISGARLVLEQAVLRDEDVLARAEVTLVSVHTADQRPIPVPGAVKAALEAADGELNQSPSTLGPA